MSEVNSIGIHLPVYIDLKGLESVEEAKTNVKGLGEELTALQKAITSLPDDSPIFDTIQKSDYAMLFSTLGDNIDDLMRLRNNIDTADNAQDQEIALTQYKFAKTNARKSLDMIGNEIGSYFNLLLSFSDQEAKIFSEGIRSVRPTMEYAFNETAKALSVTGTKGKSEIIKSFKNSGSFKSLWEPLQKQNPTIFTDERAQKYLESSFSTMVSKQFVNEFTGWSNEEIQAPTHFKLRLPSKFRSLPLVRNPELKPLDQDSTPLTKDERDLLEWFIKKTPYLADEAEQAGLIKRYNGNVYSNPDSTRAHVGAFGGNLLRLFEAGERGGAGNGITNLETQKFTDKQLTSLLNKTNSSVDNSLHGARFLQDNFPWLVPTYTEQQNTSLNEYWRNIGSYHSPGRQRSMSLFQITPEDVDEKGNVHIKTQPNSKEANQSQFQPMIYNQVFDAIERLPSETKKSLGINNFEHNGFSKDMILIQVPVEELENPNITPERKAEIHQELNRAMMNTRLNGERYVPAGYTGTHAVMMREKVHDAIEKENPGFFSYGGIMPEEGLDYASFLKYMDYSRKNYTDAEPVSRLYGTDLSDAQVVVAKMKDITGIDGQNIGSKRYFPETFLSRGFRDKGTTQSVSLEDLFANPNSPYYQYYNPENDMVTLPRGGIDGGPLSFELGKTAVIEDWENIKTRNALEGLSQEELNKERTEDLRKRGWYAKTSVSGFHTNAKYISSQEASTLELDHAARDFFTDVALKRIADFQDPVKAIKMLFSGEDVLSRTISQDPAKISEPAAQTRIDEAIAEVFKNIGQGRYLLPDDAGSYAMLSAWIPNIINGLIGDENLTPEQRQVALKENEVAYLKDFTSRIWAFRNPSTINGNINAENKANSSSIQWMADQLELNDEDRKQLFVNPAGTILSLMQGADLDSDTAHVTPLRSILQNNRSNLFGQIMRQVLINTAERNKGLMSEGGYSEQELAEIEALHTSEKETDKEKFFANNTPEGISDMNSWFINTFGKAGHMGFANAVSLYAHQYPMSPTMKRALQASEKDYDYMSVFDVKKADEWKPTKEEREIIGKGAPFFQMYRWARDAEKTAQEEYEEGGLKRGDRYFDYQSFFERGIDKVNYPSIHDSHGMETDFTSWLMARRHPGQMKRLGYDWEDIFAHAPEVDENTRVGQFVKEMRTWKAKKANQDFLIFDDDLVARWLAMAENAKTEIGNDVRKEGLSGSQAKREILKRFAEIGGNVPEFIQKYGATRSNIAGTEYAPDILKYAMLYGEDKIFGGTGAEIPERDSPIFSSIESIQNALAANSRKRAEIEATIQKEKEEEQSKPDKALTTLTAAQHYEKAKASKNPLQYIQDTFGVDQNTAQTKLNTWTKEYENPSDVQEKTNETKQEPEQPLVTTSPSLPEDSKPAETQGYVSPVNYHRTTGRFIGTTPATKQAYQEGRVVPGSAISGQNVSVQNPPEPTDPRIQSIDEERKNLEKTLEMYTTYQSMLQQVREKNDELRKQTGKQERKLDKQSDAAAFIGLQKGLAGAIKKDINESFFNKYSDELGNIPGLNPVDREVLREEIDKMNENVHKTILNQAKLYSQGFTENLEKDLGKAEGEPDKRRQKLDEHKETYRQIGEWQNELLNERKNATPTRQKEIDETLDWLSEQKKTQQESFTKLGNLYKDQIKTENQYDLDKLQQDLGVKDKFSPEVISAARLQQIADIRKKVDQRFKDKFISEDEHKQASDLLDSLENQFSVDAVRKAQEPLTQQKTYEAVTKANQLADIVERANGLGRFAANEPVAPSVIENNDKKIMENAQNLEQKETAAREAEISQTRQDQEREIENQNNQINQAENQQEESNNQNKQGKRQDSERDIFEKRQRQAREDVQRDKKLSKRQKRALTEAIDFMTYDHYAKMEKDNSGSQSEKEAFARIKMQDYDQGQGNEAYKNARIEKARELLAEEKQRREANGLKFNNYDRVDSALKKLSNQPYEGMQNIINSMDPNSEINKTILDYLQRPEAIKAGGLARRDKKLEHAPEDVRLGIASKEAEQQRMRDQNRIEASARRRMEEIQSTYLDQESKAPLEKGKISVEEGRQTQALNKQVEAAGEVAYKEAVQASYSKTASEIANKYIDSNKAVMESMGIDTEDLRKMSESFTYEQLKNMSEQAGANGISKEGTLAGFAKHVLDQTEVVKPHGGQDLWSDRDELNAARRNAEEIKRQELFPEYERIRTEAEAARKKAEDAPEVARIKAQEKLMADKTAAEAKAEGRYLDTIRGFNPEFEGKSRAQQEADVRNEAQAAQTAADKEKYAQYFPQAAIETTAQAIESIPSEAPKVDASAVQQAEQQKAQEAVDNVASAIGKSDVGQVSTEEPKEDKTPKAPAKPEEPQKPAMTQEEYEAAAKTSQVAQGIREQIQYLGGLKNRNAYEEATYQRLLAINPETNPQHYEQVQQSFLQQQQAQQEATNLRYEHALATVKGGEATGPDGEKFEFAGTGNLAVEARRMQYEQYNRQRDMRGMRSRAASFYMQDLARKDQLSRQVKEDEQKYAQQQMKIADMRATRKTITDDEKGANYDKEIGIEEAKLASLGTQLKDSKKEFEEFNSSATAGSAVMESFGSSISMALSRFGRQMFRKALNDVKQFVKQFDKSMTEIQMITLKSDDEINQLGSKLIQTAKSSGATVSDVTSAASNLYRQGLSDEEVTERLDDVIKFSKVAGIKTTEASKIITTAMQNGLVGNSTEAMDALVALGDSAATTASDIAKGMQKSAAAAKQSGMSYGELVTLLAIGTSKTQLGGSTIGSTLNTLIYRLYKVNKGQDFTDENGNHIAATDATAALSRIGVSLFDDKGNFRGPYQILQDIAANWENADDVTQSAILTTLGAGRQRSNVATFLQGMAEDNGEIAGKYESVATTSQGITDRKYEDYLDSLEAKQNNVKTSWQEMINGFVNVDLAKGGLDFISVLVQGFTEFNSLLGGIPTGIMAIAGALAAVEALIKVGFFSNPAFLAALPYIAAIAGVAGLGISIGSFISANKASEAAKKENKIQAIQNLEELRDNYASHRQEKSEKYARDLQTLNDLIEDRKKGDWNEDKAKLFNETFTSITGVVADVSSSLESMAAAADTASESIKQYNEQTQEQLERQAKRLIEERQNTYAERIQEINDNYNFKTNDLLQELVKYSYNSDGDAAKGPLSTRFVGSVKGKVSQQDAIREMAYGIESSNPKIQEAIEGAREGWLFEDHYWNKSGWNGKWVDYGDGVGQHVFANPEALINWLYSGEGSQKAGIQLRKSNADYKVVNGAPLLWNPGTMISSIQKYDKDKEAWKNSEFINKSLIPLIGKMYKLNMFGEGSLETTALDSLYGSEELFLQDAQDGFSRMWTKYRNVSDAIFTRLVDKALKFSSGGLVYGEDLVRPETLINEGAEKKEEENDDALKYYSEIVAKTYGIDEVGERAIYNKLKEENYAPNSHNLWSHLTGVVGERNQDATAFDTKYASELLPVKYGDVRYRSIEDAVNQQLIASFNNDENYANNVDQEIINEKESEIRKKLAKDNDLSGFSYVESGLAAASTGKKTETRIAESVYDKLNEDYYIGENNSKKGIENLKDLFQVLSMGYVEDFESLMKLFPELAKFLDQFLEDDGNGGKKIKDEYAEDSVIYQMFKDLLAGGTEKEKDDAYQTNAETYEYAMSFEKRLRGQADENGHELSYESGTDTIGEKAFATVYGSNFASKMRAGESMSPLEYLAKPMLSDNYANGQQGFTDANKLALSNALVREIATGNFTNVLNTTSSDVLPSATSFMTSDYIASANALSNYNKENGTAYTMDNLYEIEERAFSKNATQEDVQLYNDVTDALAKQNIEFKQAERAQDAYQDSVDKTAEKLKNGENYTEAYNTGLAMQSKDLKTANDGLIRYNQTMNSILAAQYQRRKFYEGKGYDKKQIAEMVGMTEKQVGDYKNKSKIEEQLKKQEVEQLDMINAILKGQTEDLQTAAKEYYDANKESIDVDLGTLEINMHTSGYIINDTQLEQMFGSTVAAQMRAIAAAANGQGVETDYEVFSNGDGAPQVRVVARALGEGTKGGGGGGGGGKSGIDKLIEKQKHIITEITHKSNMLQIKEQRFEYNNSYGAWERNIDKQIRMQEKLRKAYAQNISELKRMLSNVKKGSDDWYKLKEAIQQAQEEMAKTKNTINELNEKKINIIQTKADNRMSYAKHRTTMLDKYAQRAMTAGNFKDYVTLSEAEIKSNEDQIKKNNKTINEWKKELENTKEKTKKWYEIRDKIFQLEEENAELENSILQKRNDLLDQQLNQIAKVLQYNTQRNTHNISISDTLGNYLQSAGYRDMYGVTLETKQRNNNDILKQNIKAKKEAEEQLKGVKKGTEEWYKITAEIYKYEEAIAQAKVTQLELNKAMQENELEKIKENYSDATNEIDHTNDALQKFYQNALDRKDYKAYFAATDMYLNNITSKSTLLEDKLKGLNKLYKKAIKEGADPNTIRQLRDEIKQTESELQQLGLDAEKIKREVQKVQVDVLLEEQSLSSSNYEHNQRLLGYDTSTFQSNGELTNQNKALKEDNKLRKNRIKQLDIERKELDKLLEEVKGNVTEENRLNEAIKKNEESRASENAQIDKNNKLITENTKKIKQVRKALEDSIDKEIEEEKKRKREILSANVSMQDTIVDLLKKRLQDEWNLKKKDIEKEKESLNEYKKLINERFNYRKNAAQQADREEELADYRRQLALLEADVTRTKEAKELRRKIEEMEKENAWTTAEDELNAENERIDEQMEGMDKFIQYNEELLNDILGDANNFADEMNNILSGSFEESYKKIMNFMKLENEAFMKSLPDAQQQMIQSWEDTWKKAKDIIDTNYPQIKNYLDIYDSKGNLKSYDELSKPEYRENYIKWMKNNDQDYRKAREEGNKNTMKLLEIGYGETFDNFLNSIKSDYKFTPDTHTLSDVKSSIDDLKDNIYQVKDGEKFVNDINSTSIAVDDIRDLFVDLIDWVEQIHIDLSEGNETPTVESYTGVGSTDDGDKNTSKKKKEKEKDKDKDKVRFVRKHYERIDSTHHYKVDEYSDGSEKKYKQLHEFVDGRCKLCGQSIKPANKTINGTYTVNAGGGLVDYTGFAWVDGTPTKPEAFLSAKDTSNIRAMLNAFDYVQSVPVMSCVDPSCFNNTTNVGDINITINQAELKSDADIAKLAKQVGQAFTRELQKDGLNLAGYSFG